MSPNERVKEIRKAKGLTLEKFGSALGIGKTAVSKIEHGENALTEQNIKSICREFGINEVWLRTGEETMEACSDDDLRIRIDKLINDEDEDLIKNIKVENYLNKTTDYVNKNTKSVKKLYLGTGNKVIGQYPEEGASLDINDILILKTNDNSYKLPDLKGFSKKEVKTICNLLNINCTFKGYGYVDNQTLINKTVKEKNRGV